METPKEFLIEWLKSYTGLNTQSIYDLAKEVDNRYTKALQFQQTGVNGGDNYHAKEIVKILTSRPHLEDVDGFYDIYNDELQMIDIVKKYLSKYYR